jgi:alkylhydroperoxidase/carboxymuconolactone decarboxylase family protein YurZ
MSKKLPPAAGDVAELYPELWEAYAALGKACAETGALNDRERRLVKLALAIGASSEGAVHSHARRAKEEGIDDADLRQVTMLAIPTLGFPRAVAAYTWVRDVVGEE